MGRSIRGISFSSVILVLVFLTFGNVSAAEAPAIQWQKLLGGSSSEWGYSIQQTNDGGSILTGYTWSSVNGDITGTNHGGEDVWVVKLDHAGTPEWQKLLGGNNDEMGSGIRQTNDGGYILVGTTSSSASGDVTGTSHGDNDVWVVKLDSTGTIAWQKLLGGSSWEEGNGIQQTSDGGYILIGSSGSSASGDVTTTSPGGCNVWVVKLDSTGTIAWQKLLGGSSGDWGNGIQQTSDGGYILTGYSWSSESGDITGINHGGYDIWVVKLDSAGTLQWDTLLGGSNWESGRSIRQTSDGGYILTGETNSGASGDVTGTNHGNNDIWVVKLDSAGTIAWQKLLGGSSDESGRSVRQTSDGGYILTGETTSGASGDVTGTNHGSTDVWVVKLDSAGTIAWQKLMGGENNDWGSDILQTGDSGDILTGATSSDASGDVTGINHGGYDIWVVKLAGDPVIPLPGYTDPPTDPDSDGIYEDLNANSRKDFADIVLYFNQMTWIAVNEPVAAFDLNNNNRIDFADIVALFNEI